MEEDAVAPMKRVAIAMVIPTGQEERQARALLPTLPRELVQDRE